MYGPGVGLIRQRPPYPRHNDHAVLQRTACSPTTLLEYQAALLYRRGVGRRQVGSDAGHSTGEPPLTAGARTRSRAPTVALDRKAIVLLADQVQPFHG